MKKTICLLLVLSVLWGLVGCRSSFSTVEDENTTTTSSTAFTTEPTSSQPTTPSAPTKPSIAPTVPSIDVTEPDEPPDVPEAPKPCDHQFAITAQKESTCTIGGFIESTCTLCGETESDDLAPTGHTMAAATCTIPKTCSICGTTDGQPLGHSYTGDKCTRCGHKMPNYEDTTPNCTHNFRLTAQMAPGCTTTGTFTYTCSLCSDSYTESIAAVGHIYTDATCEVPKTCIVCATTNGAALGHAYGDDHLCVRCGTEDPNKPTEPVDFTVTIRNKNSQTISGVSVTVYVDSSSNAAGTAITGSNGKAVIRLMPGSSYKVVLSHIPAGYEAKDSYTFHSLITNITLDTIPVITPNDHSKAQYKVGSTMGDFTLTDVDGITYNLSELLKTKNAVILNFWFVSCAPCKAEFPYFEEVYKSYDDVQLLTMSHLDTESQIRALREQMGMTFPMICENIGLREGFGLKAYPTTVVIDKNGKILIIHTGSYSKSEVINLFDTYSKS